MRVSSSCVGAGRTVSGREAEEIAAEAVDRIRALLVAAHAAAYGAVREAADEVDRIRELIDDGWSLVVFP